MAMQSTKGFELFTKTFQEQYNIDANMLRGVAWEVWQNELSKSDREAWESMAAPKTPNRPFLPQTNPRGGGKNKISRTPPCFRKKARRCFPSGPLKPLRKHRPNPRITEARAAKPKPKKQVEHKIDVAPQPRKGYSSP